MVVLYALALRFLAAAMVLLGTLWFSAPPPLSLFSSYSTTVVVDCRTLSGLCQPDPLSLSLTHTSLSLSLSRCWHFPGCDIPGVYPGWARAHRLDGGWRRRTHATGMHGPRACFCFFTGSLSIMVAWIYGAAPVPCIVSYLLHIFAGAKKEATSSERLSAPAPAPHAHLSAAAEISPCLLPHLANGNAVKRTYFVG